jgi:hypothetical protein
MAGSISAKHKQILPPSSGGSGSGGMTFAVAASDSLQEFKDKAPSRIMGTNFTNANLQTLVNSIVSARGGIIEFAPGTYQGINITVTGTGNYLHNTITFKGAGMGATELVSSSGANLPIFKLTKAAVVNIEDMTFKLQGNNQAITSTKATVILDDTDYRGFWNSNFKNLYIEGLGTHTGFALSLGSPFRSTFENIDILNTRKGLRLFSEDNAFNPGDCTFTRIFHDVGASGNSTSVGYEIESTTANGYMNHMRFTLCECIGAATGGGGTGIKMFGVSEVSNVTFTDCNLEDMTICLDLQRGYSNIFEFNYINVLANGTFFKLGANTGSNTIRKGYVGIYNVGSTTVVNDANTDTGSRNVYENLRIQVDAGSSALASGAGVTGNVAKFYRISGYNAGTISPQIAIGTGY